MTATAVIAAGGKGTRMGAGFNKVFMKLGDDAVIMHTMRVFEKNPRIDEIVVVTGAEDIGRLKALAKAGGITKLKAAVEGGSSRRESVYNGIQLAAGDIIAVHDGARALITQDAIDAVIRDAELFGAAALGVTCKDTLKSADAEGFISGTLDRSSTYLIQTPQAFKRDIIISAHERARAEGVEATDDCALAERMGVKVKITEGSYENIKLTTPEDMIIGGEILRRRICG